MYEKDIMCLSSTQPGQFAGCGNIIEVTLYSDKLFL